MPEIMYVVCRRGFVKSFFPSLGWSSCFSLRSRRYGKSRIALGGFSGPSVRALGGDPQGLSPFQFLLCFDPICDAVCQHFFISFSRASFCLLNPIFQFIFLA